MTSRTYDIFSGDPTTGMWVESVDGLVQAQKRLKQLAAESPGPYFIFDPKNSEVVASIVALRGPE